MFKIVVHLQSENPEVYNHIEKTCYEEILYTEAQNILSHLDYTLVGPCNYFQTVKMHQTLGLLPEQNLPSTYMEYQLKEQQEYILLLNKKDGLNRSLNIDFIKLRDYTEEELVGVNARKDIRNKSVKLEELKKRVKELEKELKKN